MNKWLDELPTTNFKALCVVLITMLTAVGLGAMLWMDKKPDIEILIAWLTFLSSLWGIHSWQFYLKRKTQFDPERRASGAIPQVKTDG